MPIDLSLSMRLTSGSIDQNTIGDDILVWSTNTGQIEILVWTDPEGNEQRLTWS